MENGKLTAIIFLIVIVGLVTAVGGRIFNIYKTDISNEDYGTIYNNANDEIISNVTSSVTPINYGLTSSSAETYNNSWLSFDGVNDDIDIGHVQEGASELSECGWVYLENYSNDGTLGFISTAGGASRISLMTGDDVSGGRGDFNFQMRNETSGTTGYVLGNFSLYDWEHLCMVYNSTHVIGYVNGTRTSNFTSATIDGVTLNGTVHVHLGYDPWNPNPKTMRGRMDELRIYNRTLTDAEILEIYNSGLIANSSLPSDDLIAWYSFNEASGSTLYDKIGGYNGI